jgi:hypothetical protein
VQQHEVSGFESHAAVAWNTAIVDAAARCVAKAIARELLHWAFRVITVAATKTTSLSAYVDY